MANSRFNELFDLYYRSEANAEELQSFRAMIASGDYDQELETLMKQYWNNSTTEVTFFSDEQRSIMLDQILQPSQTTKVHKLYWIKRATAVAAVLILAAGSYFYFKDEKPAPSPVAQVSGNDIAPGHAGAIVILSNGKKIALDTAKDGLIAMDGNVRVIKEKGQLRYEGSSKEISYNTTSTDRGRSWPVTLPDGSIAWLNTSSSIHYPISFIGKERKVQMTGECYFEVIHNDKMPFRVELPNGEVVEDVGTAFNIRAYKDEAITKTTVTEGVANISTDYMKYIITAGRQAESQEGKITRVAPAANMDEITAWKDNRFRFRNASVQQILQEASRWYDMDVQYNNEIKDTYTISMSRAVPLSKLLNDLEQSGGVHFKIEGTRVIVTQ
jgi:transmembrane sensor